MGKNPHPINKPTNLTQTKITTQQLQHLNTLKEKDSNNNCAHLIGGALGVAHLQSLNVQNLQSARLGR